MNVYRQSFYEKITGERHEITTNFVSRRVYEVRVDGDFYATAESRCQAFNEVSDILKTTGWSPLCPV